MTFYSNIAPYYDLIFPVSEKQLKFLEQHITRPSASILDIACGNGHYAVELAKKGHFVTGIDSDSEMISNAKTKAELAGCEVAFIECPMQNLAKVIEGNYALIYCIGNSLVHLSSKEVMKDFLKQVYESLEETGEAIVQIINYNRIFHHKTWELPEIRDDNQKLTFTRYYEKQEGKENITFSTTLKVGDQELKQSTELFPLLKEELEELAQAVGFKTKACYGSFDQEAYTPTESYHCILVLKK